jgi:hypothetical protein
MYVGFLLAWFSTLRKVINSSEMSVQEKNTRHYIPQYGNIHNYHRENLKYCETDITMLTTNIYTNTHGSFLYFKVAESNLYFT